MTAPVRLGPKHACAILLLVYVAKGALWAWGVYTAVSMGLLA